MSHSPQRKEKDCLNCGAIVQGRYCQVCGQENLEPKESFWAMVTHFFNDITHFDGKFFETLKDLLIKPGFLSSEYMRGKRASYLHPVRMYVFTSAIFFLLFFSINGPGNVIKFGEDEPFSREAQKEALQDAESDLKRKPRSIKLQQQVAILSDTTRPVRPSQLFAYNDNFTLITTIGGDYTSKKQYDSVQASYPAARKDNWLKGLWNKNALRQQEKYQNDPTMSAEKLIDIVLHKLPYLLFVSLPFFALILKLLYIRRRKQFYYADHAIFSVHHYILSFILMMFIFLWDKLNDWTGWELWDIMLGITLISWPVYLYLGMKRFYRQGHIKTFFKFCLLNLLGLIVLCFLFIFFSLFSIFTL